MTDTNMYYVLQITQQITTLLITDVLHTVHLILKTHDYSDSTDVVANETPLFPTTQF